MHSALMREQTTKGAMFKRQGLAGQVADELRRRILAGELHEGDQLMQEQLAAEFGISKVPVREAFFQLEAEGFVVQEFHRGAVVAGLSPAQLMEIFELRTQIEVWLLGLAMAVATPKDVKAAEAVTKVLARTKDVDKAWELNWRFHEALYRPAGKPFVIDHLKKLHFQTARYVRMQYSVALDREEINREHLTLIELYANKRPDATEWLRRHILHSAEQLTAHLVALNEQRSDAKA